MPEYTLVKDDFDGADVCEKCPRLIDEGICSAYSHDGMIRWQKMGHCALSGRWANWREDRPIDPKAKKRVGQGKTRSGGNL